MSRTAAVCLLLAVALTGTALAQSNTSTVRDPNALAILQQAVTVLGGSAIGQVQDCTATGSTQAGAGSGLTSGSFRWENSGREFRYETPSASGTQVLLSGHGNPAVMSGEEVTKLSQQSALANFPLHLPGLILMRALTNQHVGVQLLDAELVNGRTAFRVQILLGTRSPGKNLNGQQWLFDAATLLPLRVEYRLAADDGGFSLRVAAEFSDYRSISGVLVPFQITTFWGGTVVATYTLNSVSFNSGILSSEFDLPAGGAQ